MLNEDSGALVRLLRRRIHDECWLDDSSATQNARPRLYAVIKYACLSRRDAKLAAWQFNKHIATLIPQDCGLWRARRAHTNGNFKAGGGQIVERRITQPIDVPQIDMMRRQCLPRPNDHLRPGGFQLDDIEGFARCNAQPFPAPP